MNRYRQEAEDFAQRMIGLGFTAYIAESGEYGFITDDTESRVLSFNVRGYRELSNNYGPPSRESGTGWLLPMNTYDLKTAIDVTEALYAMPPPSQCGSGWKYLTSVKQYLDAYGASSRFTKVERRLP